MEVATEGLRRIRTKLSRRSSLPPKPSCAASRTASQSGSKYRAQYASLANAAGQVAESEVEGVPSLLGSVCGLPISLESTAVEEKPRRTCAGQWNRSTAGRTRARGGLRAQIQTRQQEETPQNTRNHDQPRTDRKSQHPLQRSSAALLAIGYSAPVEASQGHSSTRCRIVANRRAIAVAHSSAHSQHDTQSNCRPSPHPSHTPATQPIRTPRSNIAIAATMSP